MGLPGRGDTGGHGWLASHRELTCWCVQVVMAFMWSGGKLGLSFYVPDSTDLHIMPDAAEADDFSLLQRGQPAG